jgi:hypothetical protein
MHRLSFKHILTPGASGAGTCTDCERGKHSMPGSTECDMCPAGKYLQETFLEAQVFRYGIQMTSGNMEIVGIMN